MTYCMFEKEIEIENMELSMMVSQLNTPFFESGNGENIIVRICKKIRELIEKCKNGIIKLFSSKGFKKKEDEINSLLSKNPKLKNEKIKIRDYKKLDKLDEDTYRQLKKSNDPDAVIEKYKKQRNAIIAGSTMSIGIAAALLYIKNRSHRKFLDQIEKDTFDYEKALQNAKNDENKKGLAKIANNVKVKNERDKLLEANQLLQKRINSTAWIVKAVTVDETSTPLETIEVITTLIKAKLGIMQKEQEKRVNSITGNDETSIYKRDKETQRLNNIKNLAGKYN